MAHLLITDHGEYIFTEYDKEEAGVQIEGYSDFTEYTARRARDEDELAADIPDESDDTVLIPWGEVKAVRYTRSDDMDEE